MLLYFRGLFIIDDKGTLRQITMNDLPVSNPVGGGQGGPIERYRNARLKFLIKSLRVDQTRYR